MSLVSLILSLLVVVTVVVAAAAAGALSPVEDSTTTGLLLFEPMKLSYETLLHLKANKYDGDAVLRALSETGMISITNVPAFDPVKDETLRWMHACALESQATKEQTLEDGTRRRTLATHTLPPNGQGDDDNHNNKHTMAHQVPHSVPCDQFDAASQAFRAKVADVTHVFAEVLSSLLDTEIPILQKKTSNNHNANADTAYDTFADVVKNGEHLEHFHSYQKFTETESDEISKETIEMHVDQGLFLVFTPGRLADASPSSSDNTNTAKTATLTDGFYIQLADGSRAMVNFDPEDDLVILLGDGVNQYLNRKIQPALRAAPHALVMAPMTDKSSTTTVTTPEAAAAAARVWYGRMVLPPANAIHPDYHDRTFGELREKLIAASIEDVEDHHLTIGCSSTMQARKLQNASTCAQDTLYCWHQCANLTQYNVSTQICSSRRLSLICADPTTGQLWDGIAHGDYVPVCGGGGSSSASGGSSSASNSSTSGGSSSSSSAGTGGSNGGGKSSAYGTPSGSKTSGAACAWIGTKFALWMGIASGAAYGMSSLM
jgi:hypothetical protein